ncbi:4Fe-4S binding protein [Elusimicrobiota bacterium]
MKTRNARKIVHIDEEKCDGCGECVPSCAEGAIKIIDGKARLMADNLCDGLGACLGTCPNDAIRVEERPAEAFDEEAVKRQKAEDEAKREKLPCGCPGSMARMLKKDGNAKPSCPSAAPSGKSQLRHWPVQLTLLPEKGPIWEKADVLLAADCVPFALPDFHERFLAGKSLAIACPKLDDPNAYIDKLARIFKGNEIGSLTVARMEVPCCGLDQIVQMAMEKAGKKIPLDVTVIGVSGDVLNKNG